MPGALPLEEIYNYWVTLRSPKPLLSSGCQWKTVPGIWQRRYLLRGNLLFPAGQVLLPITKPTFCPTSGALSLTYTHTLRVHQMMQNLLVKYLCVKIAAQTSQDFRKSNWRCWPLQEDHLEPIIGDNSVFNGLLPSWRKAQCHLQVGKCIAVHQLPTHVHHIGHSICDRHPL